MDPTYERVSDLVVRPSAAASRAARSHEQSRCEPSSGDGQKHEDRDNYERLNGERFHLGIVIRAKARRVGPKVTIVRAGRKGMRRARTTQGRREVPRAAAAPSTATQTVPGPRLRMTPTRRPWRYLSQCIRKSPGWPALITSIK
jgi:hypothetical protein